MIEINNLQKSYNNTTVLKDINLTIQDSEIYGLVGRSGAGKSTLLRCINGLETYDSGSGKIIKITYAESQDNNRILSDMARELNVGFSLSGAKLERYRDAVLGSIVLAVDEDRIEDIGGYLTKCGVSWEVLNND